MTPAYINEALTESKVSNKRYVVVEGKIMENDEYRLEDMLNDIDSIGYDFVQIIYSEDQNWVDIILRRK